MRRAARTRKRAPRAEAPRAGEAEPPARERGRRSWAWWLGWLGADFVGAAASGFVAALRDLRRRRRGRGKPKRQP